MQGACPFTLAALSLRPALLHALRQDFPSTCLGRVEDAVSEALLAALKAADNPRSCHRRALEQDGLPGLRRALRRTAWYHLRGHHRLSATRHEQLPGTLPDPGDHHSPEEHLIALDRARELERLILGTARRHAPRDPERLRRALEDALRSGDPLTVVARRNQVCRKPLNLARNHLLHALSA